MKYIYSSVFLVLLLTVSSAPLAQVMNGFDLSGASIDASEIHHGGPPRDGIPSIDQPRFIAADEASFLQPDDRILGVYLEGIARAYPLAILNWHEVVNDTFGDVPVTVTFCPLCASGMAFAAEIEQERLDFGVSGLLYNSDVLLYDHQSESLWSQIMSQAISGPMKGVQLEFLPTSHTSWDEWRSRHPDTQVLSTDTGFRRDYRQNPYASYINSDRLMFPVAMQDARMHPKTYVIGVNLNGEQKAYPFPELMELTDGRLEDNIGGELISLEFDAQAQTGRVFDHEGTELPSLIAFWFAWFGFHPETRVFELP
ncbi:DUF3179 domain-containing protein [Nitrincola alkalilacustris]|uniref:DUF3179 domain-containing protein n=1 Tax=Nitrincola alkalilacustris TaxID=1571224 RepID=UPI00124D921E|nr:DUF3179 domain-containing protein [Nitrincola alkalilacustris]